MTLTGILLLSSGCTLNFQNIDTHGTASDLVDETMTTDLESKVSIPGV